MARRTLRGQLTLTFAVGAVVLAGLFGSVTYFGVRHVLVTSRQSSDLQQAYVNAALVRSAIANGSDNVAELLQSLDLGTSSISFVRVDNTWFSGATSAAISLPRSVQREVSVNGVERQVVSDAGRPVLLISVAIPSVSAVYVQRRDLGDLNGTMQRLLNFLVLASVVTGGIGAAAGRRATRRVTAPLRATADAVRQITDGALSVRLDTTAPHEEVATLARAFNEMLEELVARLERDARFASDVSHELRSPLTTLAMTADVLHRYADELSAEGREALALLVSDVGTFQSLVEDLLEIAKSDAGATDLLLETLPVPELVRQCVTVATRRHQLPTTVTTTSAAAQGAFITVDRRRFERVITNLLDNAYRYGHSTVTLHVDVREDLVVLDVDDDGPGVPEGERARVFERFYRGASAGSRGASRGTGLGLSLVLEHVTKFHGSVQILESPQGGCRVRLELPLVARGHQ